MVIKNYCRGLLIGVVLVSAATGVSAAVLVDEATLVSKSVKYAQVAPEPRSFTVSAAGRYRVTLTDVGFPAPMPSLDLIITKGTQVVARSAGAGINDFDATPGTYTVHVLGSGGTVGTCGVVIEPIAGGAPLLTFQAGIVANLAAAAAPRSTLETRFSANLSGTYQLTVTDRRFPAALLSVDVVVVNASGAIMARVCQPAIPSVCDSAPVSFPAIVGDYDMFVNAVAANPMQAGLYSVNIARGIASGASNVVLYAATHPVGVLEAQANLEFPAAGQYALAINDLQFPVALTNVKAVIVQGSDLLTSVSSATAQATTQPFAAMEGQAALYTVATPAPAQGVGTLGVLVTNGTQALYSDAHAVLDANASGARAYAIVGTVPSAGQYRVQARDFAFPASIPALQLLVTQDGASLGAVTVGGSLNVRAKTGKILIVAIANMLSSASPGLFAVTVDAQPSGAEILTVAQGIGDLFHSRTLTVGNTGSLDVTLSDMGWPASFQNLMLAVTRGNTMVGQILGGGTFTFPTTPGDYSLNFVARNNAADNYGLYGIKVADTPPAPTVNFTSAATSVPAQGSASVSWSTTDASSCAASGAASWVGARGTSGTNVSVGPITSDTTLTLSCTGPGGTKSADVRITVASVAVQSESGGGSIALWQLIALALLSLQVVQRRLR